MAIKKPRPRRPELKRGLVSKRFYIGRMPSPGCPSVPAELGGKWIARVPRGLIIASGDTLSEVMDEVASKGVKQVSYGRRAAVRSLIGPLTMRFPYISYDAKPWPANKTGKVWIPELDVMVSGTGEDAVQITLSGLVNIGATECILPYEVADKIKATPFDDGVLFDYSGRPHTVQYAVVYLELHLEKQSVRWLSVIALDHSREDSALWGRCGFLDYFRVTFDGPAKHFTIRRRGPTPKGMTVSRISKAT